MSQDSRLAKKKRSARKRVEENQMCAFDLLAAVAGRLLLEKEISPLPKSTIAGESLKSVFSRDKIKVEEQEEIKPCDQGNRNGSTRISKIGFQQVVQIGKADQCLHASRSMFVRPSSTVTETGPLKRVTCAGEFVFNRNKFELDQRKLSSIGHCPVSAISYQDKLEDEFTTPSQSDCRNSKIGTHGNIKDPMEIDVKPCIHGDNKVRRSSKCEGDIEFHVDENDDGKSLGRTLPGNVSSKRYRRQCNGDRRIRKLLASKFWKVGSMYVKDGDISKSDEDVKSVFYNKKVCYMRRQSQKSIFKRRRVSGKGSRLTCNGLLNHGLLNHENISHLPERSIKEEANSSPLRACGGIGTSSSTESDSVDFPVKFSIKSFKVPELLIEVPETATVGTLKRAVMEAVSAILGGGLGIGVLLEGKKVRDDNKTLLQAGISYTGELNGLGFTLEPYSSQAPKQRTTDSEGTHFLPVCDASQQIKRLPEIPASDTVVVESPAKPQPPTITTSGSSVEVDKHGDLFHPNTDARADEDPACPKALVALPAVDAATLAPGPKSRRAEAGQRRMRRPFSVSEVEALVHAVEKLGTGRWRDVKLRAFEDADHRTYVDLKDKWKTLVHTARISPQRRRGEPVPQGLLDRVLSAHAYWSQQQPAKLQVTQPELCLLAGGSSARSSSPPSPPYSSRVVQAAGEVD